MFCYSRVPPEKPAIQFMLDKIVNVTSVVPYQERSSRVPSLKRLRVLTEGNNFNQFLQGSAKLRVSNLVI